MKTLRGNNIIEIPSQNIPYEEKKKTISEVIDQLATRVGKLENLAIRRMVDNVGLDSIMSGYLSTRHLNTYFRSLSKLSELLKQQVELLTDPIELPSSKRIRRTKKGDYEVL